MTQLSVCLEQTSDHTYSEQFANSLK
jgi:hypothetical protein